MSLYKHLLSVYQKLMRSQARLVPQVLTPQILIYSLWIILILLSAGCQTTPSHEYMGFPLESPRPIPDFELLDTQQQPFRLSDVRGDIALVFFGYTYCPDVCPLTLSEVQQALVGLDGRERVHTIFISVDPERDTPEALERYVHLLDETFIGLTDDEAKTKEVLKQFGAHAAKEENPDSDTKYLVEHTATLYLINPNGEIFLTYPFGFVADDLRSDLTYLLQQ